ncbi:MAG: hypothetical protein WCY71_03050 [Halothiobacillaceae bacterium]
MAVPALAQSEPIAASADLEIIDAKVRYIEDLDLLVFEQEVAGQAGGTKPETPAHARDNDDLHWEDVAAAGNFDGSAVLSYVFPTDLPPESVGFGPVEGILALVATSHPAFDDTPLWDESGDGNYANDGGIYHAHWVVLIEDDRVPGGLAVREVEGDPAEVLPPTAPGMPIYLDSPGFQVQTQGKTVRLIVPGTRIRGALMDFGFDAVTAYLEVNISDEERPTLGVYKVYDVLSEDLSLPYEVTSD